MSLHDRRPGSSCPAVDNPAEFDHRAKPSALRCWRDPSWLRLPGCRAARRLEPAFRCEKQRCQAWEETVRPRMLSRRKGAYHAARSSVTARGGHHDGPRQHETRQNRQPLPCYHPPPSGEKRKLHVNSEISYAHSTNHHARADHPRSSRRGTVFLPPAKHPCPAMSTSCCQHVLSVLATTHSSQFTVTVHTAPILLARLHAANHPRARRRHPPEYNR